MEYSCFFFDAYMFFHTLLYLEELPSATFRHSHYLIIKLYTQWISPAHIGKIHTSTYEKLIHILSCTKKFMDHVGQQ